MYPEQQRYWVALLNLQRTWTSDEAALTFLPPRYRDFDSRPDWPRPRAIAYLLNNLELLRENHRRLESGQALEWDLLNHALSRLRLRLHAWADLEQWREASRAKRELGSRVETLQVGGDADDERTNPGTRYIRATVERSLYYFSQYVDDRLSDPLYPGVTAGRWRVIAKPDGSGDLAIGTATERAVR